MSSKPESNIPWWAIVLGFIFCWPIGMILLFLNLGGVRIPTDRVRRDFQRDFHSQQQGGVGYQYQRRQTPPPTASAPIYTGRAQTGAQGGTGTYKGSYAYGQADPGRVQQKKGRVRNWGARIKDGKGMTILGSILSFVMAIPLVDEIASFGLAFPDEWFPLFGFLCAGLFLMGTGISRTRLSRRQRLYLGVIGQRNSVFLSDLAGTAGVSEKRVISDLQKMLSEGILPMGYIDRASGRLVLTDQGAQEAPPAAAKEPEKPKAEAKEDPDDAILRQIRQVNDAIPDAEMSRKIERIEEITRKILAYQRKNPAKADQLRQFLNYYLPTTLKILNAYAQMDAQGVEGENISAAKARIEGMMDKVVEGFEKQLDQLFQTDAMDIASDVDVLEKMLEKDGLGSGMTLGG